jgi:hypothetical protein
MAATDISANSLALNVLLGNTAIFTGNVAVANISGNADGLFSIPAGNLAGTVSNARLAGDYTVANVTARAVKSLPATSLSLWSNNLQRVTITTAGNVGINKTTPNYPLDVVGNIAGSAGLALGIGGGGGYMTLDPSGISDVGTGGDPYFPSTGIGANCLGLENILSIAAGSIKFFTGPARDKLTELSNTGALTAGNVTATGNISATYMLGNGAYLTGINGFDGNASNISSGTLSNARLPSSISVSNIVANMSGNYIQTTAAQSKYIQAQSGMFSDLTVGALTALTISGTLVQTAETLISMTGAIGAVSHAYTTGALFYHTGILANFTCNVVGAPVTQNRSMIVTLVLAQGIVPYMPTALQIDGVAQTIKWNGVMVPTGTASKTDVVTFGLLRVGTAWIVLGQSSTFG